MRGRQTEANSVLRCEAGESPPDPPLLLGGKQSQVLSQGSHPSSPCTGTPCGSTVLTGPKEQPGRRYAE